MPSHIRKIIFLLLAVCGLAFFTNIPSEKGSLIVLSVASSIMAAMICLYFVGIEISKADWSKVEGLLRDMNLKFPTSEHFGRVDKNMNMGEQFWLDLIAELDSTTDAVWFMGTKLTLWLKLQTYAMPLRSKMKSRLRNIADGFLVGEKSDSHAIYLLLCDEDARSHWRDFLEDLITEVVSDLGRSESNDLHDAVWGEVHLVMVPTSLVRYSIIVCGEKCVLMLYTSRGRSGDSPTIEIKRGSAIRQLFLEDMKDIVRQPGCYVE